VDYRKFAEERIAEIRTTVGDGRAISALSGGVDSAVTTVLGHRALGDRIEVVFIDDGLMRQDEPETVKATFAALGIKVQIINARKQFFAALKGKTDPEKKRKAFRNTFYRVFGDAVRASGASFLLQGTIAADIIETQKGVKTQHNVLEQIGIDTKGGFGFQAIEPVKTLFKPEVRQLAKALGLPPLISQRMPFPGPGLATRCVGEVTPKRIEVVRRACKIVEEETKEIKLFQAFGVLLADQATGLTADGTRAFGDIIAVRCVESKDAMVAAAAQLPWPVLTRIQKRIVKEIPSVTKVVYDITPKPPSTIEYI